MLNSLTLLHFPKTKENMKIKRWDLEKRCWVESDTPLQGEILVKWLDGTFRPESGDQRETREHLERIKQYENLQDHK